MEKINIDWLRKEMEKVPFGNSCFQNEHFTDGQETPERRRRHALLQLMKRTDALYACQLRRRKTSIDLEEIEEDIKNAEGFKKRRLEINKEEKEWQLEAEVQLINDAMVEVKTYMGILSKLPVLESRDQFEKGEQVYWELRLIQDARNQIVANEHIDVGTLNSLRQIGIVMAKTKDDKICFVNKNQLIEERINNDILSKHKTDQIQKGNNKPEGMPKE